MYHVTSKDSHAIQTMPDIPPETVQSQTQFHHSRQCLHRYKEKIKIQSVKLIRCLKMIPNRNFGAHSSGEPRPDKSPMWTHGITASVIFATGAFCVAAEFGFSSAFCPPLSLRCWKMTEGAGSPAAQRSVESCTFTGVMFRGSNGEHLPSERTARIHALFS